ncbi:MAG: methylated-DNA--[protein]-cysteine S-methyltransferase, partial [Saprospiraceae bacterium]
LRRLRWLGEETPPTDHATPDTLAYYVQQLDEYFQRKRTEFDLKLDWGGATAFNRSVWKALTEIPYGRTTTYSAIANKLNNPKAVRAVGLANRNNPIGIMVPCHRVIAKSGDLQGYFYGLDMKRKLLELENPMSFAQQGSLF